MKRNLLIAFYFLMFFLGIIRFFYWLNRRKQIVLSYHNVIPDELFDYSCHLGVSHAESVFKEQLLLIRRRVASDKKTNRCLITLDDGYKNQFEIAASALNYEGLKAIFFISFELITTGNTLTIDRLMMWVSYVPEGTYVLFGAPLNINNKNRNLVASQLYDHLINDFELWDRVEKELDDSFSFDALVLSQKLLNLRFKAMEVDDLEALVKAGHVVASHSWNHRPLSTLPAEMQKKDFSICSALAKKYCNSWLYSYPFGTDREVSPLTLSLCQEYGFKAGYMNMPESPQWPGTHAQYRLSRISLPNEKNRYLLDAKLSGFEGSCKKFRQKICRGSCNV